MTIVGIDLGTTNSLVAIWHDGKVEVISNVLGAKLTPSVVGLDDTGEVLVGQAAKERLVTHPELTVASFKRWMGTDRKVRLGDREFRPDELSSFVLRALKADAEAFLGEPVKEAVISVPAYFNDQQRQATRLAGSLADLRVERLVNEPTAAALAYGLHEAEGETTFLVFDLGGGTFDVSVLELFDGVMEVHASAGDNQLGGDDFTSVLYDWFLSEEGISPASLTRLEQSALRKQAELAKQTLTNSETAELQLRLDERTATRTIARAELERLSKSLVDRLRRPVERAMRDAKLDVGKIDAVVAVGGATRMPLVRGVAAKLFGRFPLTDISPDETIAVGAAIQAGLKARDAALKETILTDVCPYSLGVGVAVTDERDNVVGQEFSPIIERNTVVPTSREQTYYPIHPGQTQILLQVYQGESLRLEHNVRIGRLEVPLPPGDRESQWVRVRFTYDINGLLEVDATVATGHKRTLVIQENPGSMTPEELQKRLKALQVVKVHPRETLENRTVLARGDRLFAENLGEVREAVRQAVARFEIVLSRQDPRAIDEARAELVKELDRIEGKVW